MLDAQEPTALVDAFALPGAGLQWRPDGRARLGVDPAAAAEAVAAAAPEAEVIVVTITPFHRPPARDDLLGETLLRLRERLPAALLLLADAYQSGQHYVEAPAAALLASYPEADAWVQYEAERTVPALLRAFREQGTRARGHHRGERPPALDELPLPAWDRVDLDAHDRFRASVVAQLGRGAWAFPIDGRTLPVVTSRGCPFTCVHCSSNPDLRPGEAKTQRRHGATRLREALERLRSLGATRVAVLDELVNVSERHLDALLKAVGELELRLEIPNGMRADYLRPEHLQAMKGRVTTVSVSAESGSPRVVRDVVRKRLDLQAIVDAARHAQQAEVPLMIHYMIGLPGETAEEINETLAFALDLWDRYRAWPAVQYATPLPGTALAAGRRLPVVDDWGPRFQTAPTATAVDDATPPTVEPARLERFMATFRRRLAASQGPEKLVMNVTYSCNNHCTFCAVGTRTQLHGFPPRQQEQLARYRARGVTMVDFDGGEPTLNPELVPLIRYARRLGYTRINVTTNGRRCAYEGYAAALVNSGLTTLLFSVHGPDARIHAQQVGVAEAFEQTVEGIRHCVRLAPRGVELGMNITLTKGNTEHLPAMGELCWSLGLRWMNVQFLTPFGRATRYLAPDTARAAVLTRELIEAWRGRMRIQVINLPFCFMEGYEEQLEGDLAKLSRHMVFVNNETVNLAEYLAERRTPRPVCRSCPHACFCGGFYELDDVPEPPWLIAAEDLVRSLDDPRRHESVPAGFRERVSGRAGGQ
ncbi:MAG: radical SAM protein [Myxococcales bacterium]|nr:radical SAM protein [Myxococcales bacterium]